MQHASQWPAEHSLEAFAEADRLRVLIVDDDEVDRLNCRRLLLQIFGEKAEIELASSWDEAHGIMSDAAHDVYFVDYSLGARTGLELIKAVSDDAAPGIFILLTGHENRQVDIAASRAGVIDYLVKGELSLGRLERCLRYAMEAARQKRLLIAQADELRKAKVGIEVALSRAEKSEGQYRWLAQHDMLTRIPNRALFAEKLRTGMQNASRSNHYLALFLLDLDRFKTINDTRGHQVGDGLLVAAADRLSQAIRETDTVARLSGDEFAIIVTNLNEKQYASVAAEKFIRILEKPFNIMGNRIEIGSSIGIAIFSPDSDLTSADLTVRADTALYRAKAAGRGQFQFFDEALNMKVQRSTLVQKELAKALGTRDLSLAFQPKINLQSGAVVGLEALARWTHPTLGPISPGEFIPAAESTGLILPLSEQIFEEACRTAVAWRGTTLHGVSIAVNLSAVQLQQHDLVADVSRLLDRYGIDPAQLELEVTETAALRNLELATAQLANLRALGVKIAIDDFGTGYSSLSLATSLPSDCLKIDRSFVSGMISKSPDAAAVSATITLAHSLNLKAVAEGVETPEELDYLRARGCDQAQGYFIARPMPADDILAWHNDYCLKVCFPERIVKDDQENGPQDRRYGNSTTRQ